MNLQKFQPNSTSADRFMRKVVRTDGCWLWSGKKCGTAGYGGFMLNTQSLQHIGAHVASFILFKGGYQHGMDVAHTCDNPACVNPAHLVQMTHRENMLDSIGKKRHPTIGVKGSSNVAYKVSDAEFEQMKKLAEETNLTNTEIGHLFGVSRSYVRLIRKGYRRSA